MATSALTPSGPGTARPSLASLARIRPSETPRNDLAWPSIGDPGVKTLGRGGGKTYHTISRKLEPYSLDLIQTCEAIVVQTPAAPRGSSPYVSFTGCLVGEDNPVKPTIVIVSSSKEYADRLHKTIKRSKMLDMGHVTFDVEVLDGGFASLAKGPIAQILLPA
jgi:hypothetical protein